MLSCLLPSCEHPVLPKKALLIKEALVTCFVPLLNLGQTTITHSYVAYPITTPIAFNGFKVVQFHSDK